MHMHIFLERPSILCLILKVMCDPSKYKLSLVEGVITHLTVWRLTPKVSSPRLTPGEAIRARLTHSHSAQWHARCALRAQY